MKRGARRQSRRTEQRTAVSCVCFSLVIHAAQTGLWANAPRRGNFPSARVSFRSSRRTRFAPASRLRRIRSPRPVRASPAKVQCRIIRAPGPIRLRAAAPAPRSSGAVQHRGTRNRRRSSFLFSGSGLLSLAAPPSGSPLRGRDPFGSSLKGILPTGPWPRSAPPPFGERAIPLLKSKKRNSNENANRSRRLANHASGG